MPVVEVWLQSELLLINHLKHTLICQGSLSIDFSWSEHYAFKTTIFAGQEHGFR